MKQIRWMKLGIGCLVMIMVLETALFSIQTFTGRLQSDSYPNNQNAVATAVVSDSSATGGFVSHAMNSRADTDGLFAAPWIPVSYIQQAIGESSLPQQNPRFLSLFISTVYTSDIADGVTDRTIRGRSNSGSLMQALVFHISRLTAG